MQTARAYRTLSAEGATHLDILLAVYDALSEDIRLAGQAAARDEIASRCRYTHDSLLLLGHMESWVPLLNDLPLQDSLSAFYMYVRSELVRLQTTHHENGFAELAMQACETRAAWQSKQRETSSCAQPFSPATHQPTTREQGTNPIFSWSV